MRTTRLLPLLILFAAMVMVLAACGDAVAPATPTAVSTTNAGATATSIATAAAVAPATNTPPVATAGAGAVPNQPDDATQARVRVQQCVYDGPAVDTYVNGKQAINAGVPMANLGALHWTGYLYLQPGTYSFALVPSGQGSDHPFVGPIDAKVEAGHRYTIVALGQNEDASHKALVIDETVAYQAVGAKSTDPAHITVNNLKGVMGIDFYEGGVVREANVPYGEFKAAIWPVGWFKGLKVTVSGSADKIIDAGFDGDGYNSPGLDFIDCWGGHYPGTMGSDYGSDSSPATSALNVVDFLQANSAELAKNGGTVPTNNTFQAALKKASLTDMLAHGGPYMVFAPTDAAFATLPKGKLDGLLADPQALTALLRRHMVEGYYPTGSLSGGTGGRGDRVLKNQLGEEVHLIADNDAIYINGDKIGNADFVMVANGTRLFSNIDKVLLPDALAEPTAAGTATP